MESYELIKLECRNDVGKYQIIDFKSKIIGMVIYIDL